MTDATQPTHEAGEVTAEAQRLAEVHQKIGALTRQLHDSLNQLGYAEKLKASAGELPDVRSRLSYIAKLTGNAAEKVLGLVDEANANSDAMLKLVKAQAPQIAQEYESRHNALHGSLTEIMMAQDFHDLTGQVITRALALTSTLESNLVELLIQTSPTGKVDLPAAVVPSEVLAGPSIDTSENSGAVANQSQVDDLLASLGF
jgi:chemotaxis protein CheZ